MTQAAMLPLALIAIGFVLFGISYAFRNQQAKRALQVAAVVAEVGAVVIAIASIGSVIGA